MPFLLTTTVMMKAVKKGMGREDAHEVIKDCLLYTSRRQDSAERANSRAKLSMESGLPMHKNLSPAENGVFGRCV